MNPRSDRHSEHAVKPSGRAYEPVTNYMVPLAKMVTFDVNQTIEEVIEIFLREKISGAPVIDGQRNLVGIISEKDCLRVVADHVYHNMPMSSRRVSDYMTPAVKTLSLQSDVIEATNEFLGSHVRRLPIVDQGVLVGQVSRRDILRAAMNLSATTW